MKHKLFIWWMVICHIPDYYPKHKQTRTMNKSSESTVTQKPLKQWQRTVAVASFCPSPSSPLAVSFSPCHYVGSHYVTKSVPSTTLAYFIAPSLCLCSCTAEEFLNSFPFMASPSFAHNPFISFHFPLTQHWDMHTESAFVRSFLFLFFWWVLYSFAVFQSKCAQYHCDLVVKAPPKYEMYKSVLLIELLF